MILNQMTIIFILFFASLLGLGIMLGKKLALLRAGTLEVKTAAEPHPFVPDWEKLKELVQKHARRYGYQATVTAVRIYVRSSNLFKAKALELRDKVAKLAEQYGGSKNGASSEPKEVNKFLRLISDYKNKVRAIKHKIHEEEKNN